MPPRARKPLVPDIFIVMVGSVMISPRPALEMPRRTAKNILRLYDIRFSKMNVCGLFIVDAALPLRLVGLIATYCIVLLQFAFL
ncbi:hypothetical protein EVAR_61227_1 [Eumeta japonica]|uniref:Uncharacterized protein n=1 Tax=Eumeta variegata TaxID=151549 RepID=A0A4C1Z8Z9_EUMVA|nr:hypothetical protein EVAR_61227_1 [Eumeta japonica]